MIKKYISKDYLKHEGISGMKWGVRNGPPYPLSAKRMSKAEKRAGNIVSKWAAKSEQSISKANDKIKSAKNDKQKQKAIAKLKKEKEFVNRANKLNNTENPFIRKNGESSKEQRKRISDAQLEFNNLNQHYQGYLKKALFVGGVSMLAGPVVGVTTSAVADTQDFKRYANVYMKQPADQIKIETMKK